MKRTVALILFFLTTFLLSGCGSWARLSEDTTYRENVTAFFDALDERDKDKITALFSDTVISEYDDFDNQLNKLLTVYPKGKTIVKLDMVQSGSYHDEGGKHMSSASSSFSVTVTDQLFWVYMDLVYEDDFSEDNIGFKNVCFYTADEYYASYNDEDATYSTPETGLFVFADLDTGKEIRCINNTPCDYTHIEREIKLADAEKFLQSNTDWDDFTAKFGEPNAADPFDLCYYEVTDDNYGTVYLGIDIENGKIVYVELVDDQRSIKMILNGHEDDA